MATLKFIGSRRAPFTVDSPVSEGRYYVEPGAPVEMTDADADAILARDPLLWARAEPTLEAVLEAAHEVEAPKRKK